MLAKKPYKKKKYKYQAQPQWGHCCICKKYQWLSPHHIYGASRRENSDRYGAYIYVCDECHIWGQNAIERTELKHQLQVEWQPVLMRKNNWTIDEFIRKFGVSYI